MQVSGWRDERREPADLRLPNYVFGRGRNHLLVVASIHTLVDTYLGSSQAGDSPSPHSNISCAQTASSASPRRAARARTSSAAPRGRVPRLRSSPLAPATV